MSFDDLEIGGPIVLVSVNLKVIEKLIFQEAQEIEMGIEDESLAPLHR
jgi:hypothetical protein